MLLFGCFLIAYTLRIVCATVTRVTAWLVLYMLPYQMNLGGTPLSISYVAGVSTAPEYRNRHLMRSLLTSTLQENTQSAIAILLPAEDWLYDYYATFGFAAVGGTEEQVVERAEATYDCPPSGGRESLTELYEFYLKSVVSRECGIVHSWDDFQTIVMDNRLSGGKIVSIAEKGRIVGLAFCYPGAESIRIKELLCDDNRRELLLKKVLSSYPNATVIEEVRQPGRKRFAMARILDVEQVLAALSKRNPGWSCEISVADPLIEKNNGIFHVAGGRITQRIGDNSRVPQISISALTKATLGGRLLGQLQTIPPIINLMLE